MDEFKSVILLVLESQEYARTPSGDTPITDPNGSACIHELVLQDLKVSKADSQIDLPGSKKRHQQDKKIHLSSRELGSK